MRFEIGKCYRHTTGLEMKVIGELTTVMWGEPTLIAEQNAPFRMTELVPIGRDESSAVNWVEISEDEFMKSYS